MVECNTMECCYQQHVASKLMLRRTASCPARHRLSKRGRLPSHQRDGSATLPVSNIYTVHGSDDSRNSKHACRWSEWMCRRTRCQMAKQFSAKRDESLDRQLTRSLQWQPPSHYLSIRAMQIYIPAYFKADRLQHARDFMQEHGQRTADYRAK